MICFQADEAAYLQVVSESIRYALLSFPFTVNRMRLVNIQQRIGNIVKGKIAEGLLREYARQRGLPFDFEAGATPYFLPDRFDFSFGKYAFDLKNNFIYHQGDMLEPDAYMKLPALVPHRFEGDQWSKRDAVVQTGQGDELEKAFLFSYLKQADQRNAPPFLRLFFNVKGTAFLEGIANDHKGIMPETAPYDADAQIALLKSRHAVPDFKLFAMPALVITGMATKNDWKLFGDTDGISEHAYYHYTGKWYEVRDDGGLAFCSGQIHTRIRNATCPVGFLPPFSEFLI